MIFNKDLFRVWVSWIYILLFYFSLYVFFFFMYNICWEKFEKLVLRLSIISKCKILTLDGCIVMTFLMLFCAGNKQFFNNVIYMYYYFFFFPGCGSGKYLGLNPMVYNIGSDRCHALAQIAREKENEITLCDNLALPYRDSR